MIIPSKSANELSENELKGDELNGSDCTSQTIYLVFLVKLLSYV